MFPLPPAEPGAGRRRSPETREKIRAAKLSRTHCIHGHAYTPENTYHNPGEKGRRCRTCMRLFSATTRARARQDRSSGDVMQSPCLNCGRMFGAADLSQRFCSHSCYHAYRTDPRAVIERLKSRVIVDAVSDCWVWQGSKATGGYGSAGHRGRTVLVHRLMWQLVRGPIPEGLTLDHLCRNTACCNPAHLEPVTNRENILRGSSFAAVNARKTHCKHGHALTPENTYRGAKGRICRTCQGEQWRAWDNEHREHRQELRRERRAYARVAASN